VTDNHLTGQRTPRQDRRPGDGGRSTCHRQIRRRREVRDNHPGWGTGEARNGTIRNILGGTRWTRRTSWRSWTRTWKRQWSEGTGRRQRPPDRYQRRIISVISREIWPPLPMTLRIWWIGRLSEIRWVHGPASG